MASFANVSQGPKQDAGSVGRSAFRISDIAKTTRVQSSRLTAFHAKHTERRPRLAILDAQHDELEARVRRWSRLACIDVLADDYL